MQIKNFECRFLKAVKREGTGKTSGKPYSFYAANIIEGADVFEFHLTDSVENRDQYLTEKPFDALVSIEFTPKGKFDVQGRIVSVERV